MRGHTRKQTIIIFAVIVIAKALHVLIASHNLVAGKLRQQLRINWSTTRVVLSILKLNQAEWAQIEHRRQ